MEQNKLTTSFSYKDLCLLEKKYLAPQVVPDECCFWMIRSKRGVFYNEFLTSQYIAIGWNALLKQDFAVDSEEQRKAKIERYYLGEKRANGCVNKCNRFIFEMKPGDLVVVVGSGEVAFCVVGDYYEEPIDKAITKELEANAQIESPKYKDFSIVCPYRKRRKIYCIKRVSENRLTPVLSNAISNRHSISAMDSYAVEILSECFDFFSYQKHTYLAFRVTTEETINFRNLSRFLFYTDEILTGNSELLVSTKVNLNSPGTILLGIPMDAINFAIEHPLSLLMLMSCLFGGEICLKGVTIKMPSVRSAIKDWREREHNDKMRTLEEKRAEAEIRKINAEALKLETDAYKTIGIEDAYEPPLDAASAKKFQGAIRNLKIAKPNLTVIDFSKYQTAVPIKKDGTDDNDEKKK